MPQVSKSRDPDQEMSPSIYAGMVDSLFMNPAPMIFGAFGPAIAGAVIASVTEDFLGWLCVPLFVVVGLAPLMGVSRRRHMGAGITILAGVLVPVVLVSAFAAVSVRYTAPVPRYESGVALLHDGTVLVAGGDRGLTFPDMVPTVTSEAVLYTPSQERWSLAAPLPAPRERFIMVPLRDGRVLVGAAHPMDRRSVAIEVSAPA